MKTEMVTIEKVADYCKVSREYLEIGREANDFAYDMLTAKLHGFIYSMAKEEGSITILFEPPTFFDWLFRRRKEKKIPYKIRELVRADKMKFPDNIRVIEIPVLDE